jgi:hypothetical protein
LIICICSDWDGDSYLNKGDLETTLLKLTQDGLTQEEIEFVVDKVNKRITPLYLITKRIL